MSRVNKQKRTMQQTRPVNTQKRMTKQCRHGSRSRHHDVATEINNSHADLPSSGGSSVKRRGSSHPKRSSRSASFAFIQSDSLNRVSNDRHGEKQNKRTSCFTRTKQAEENKAVQYTYPDVDGGGNKGLVNEDAVQNTEVLLPEVNRGKDMTLDMTPRCIRLFQSPIAKGFPGSCEDIVGSSEPTQIKKKDVDIDEKPGRNRAKRTGKLKKRNVPSGVEDNGFICIGNMRIYTDKFEDWYEEGDGPLIGERGRLSSRRFNQRGGRRTRFKQKYQSIENDMEDSEVSENFSSSEVEDDIAEDYIAGIEGDFMDGDLVLKTPLIHQTPIENMRISHPSEDTSEQSDDDTYSEESTDSDGEILQEALKEHPHAFINEGTDLNLDILKLECSTDDSEASIYDLDPQDMILGKSTKVENMKQRKQKSAHPHLTQQKRATRNKKWQHAEIIAGKRQQRAFLRGFDYAEINAELESIVVNEVDMFAFRPMHKSDCIKVQKMASIYRLKSACQASSGKKRFVMVSRTNHTSLPSANDKARLEAISKLHTNQFTIFKQSSEHSRNGERNRMASKVKRATRQAHQSMKLKPGAKQSSGKVSSSSTKRTSRNVQRSSNYANQPLSFVSSGAIRSEGDEIPQPEENVSITYNLNQNIGVNMMESGSNSENNHASSASLFQIGQFEAHTKGFGSRMLAKMGFVEGTGLGKDKQGMAQPLQAIKRPKSLGLGA